MPDPTGKGSHSMGMKKKKKKTKKMKRKKRQMVLVKSIKKFTTKLNKTQKKAMNRHARHHSLKHMKEMAKDLESGRFTFAQAHTRAMRKVGK